MLEDHAVDFIKKWGSGFGTYGEQGAESIHAEFNKMKINYNNMYPPTRRLTAILHEHYRKVYPESTALRPQKKILNRPAMLRE